MRNKLAHAQQRTSCETYNQFGFSCIVVRYVCQLTDEDQQNTERNNNTIMDHRWWHCSCLLYLMSVCVCLLIFNKQIQIVRIVSLKCMFYYGKLYRVEINLIRIYKNNSSSFFSIIILKEIQQILQSTKLDNNKASVGLQHTQKKVFFYQRFL